MPLEHCCHGQVESGSDHLCVWLIRYFPSHRYPSRGNFQFPRLVPRGCPSICPGVGGDQPICRTQLVPNRVPYHTIYHGTAHFIFHDSRTVPSSSSSYCCNAAGYLKVKGTCRGYTIHCPGSSQFCSYAQYCSVRL